MSLSASQASATQKLLEHIRSTPQKDDASASFAPPLQIPPAAPLRPLFGKERSVVGIDVGKGRICLVQRRAGSTPILEAIQSFSIPETMDWETPGLADRIREALSAFLPHGGRDADIWVRLPDGQDELRHYRIPKVSPKDRDAIAKMAAIREKPFDEAENIFDYRVNAEVLDKGVPRLPVTAMIANKGAANTVRHTLAAAGVSPAGITSGNIYAQNLFASGWLSSPWEHFAFADIGEDSTRIEIFSGTNIALSRTIKTGLRSLVTALQESYGGRRKKTPPPPVVPPMPADGGVGRGACRVSLRTAAGRFIVHVALGPVPVDPAAGIPAAGAVSSTAVPNGYGHGFGTCRAFRARSVPILPRRKNSGR